MCYVVVVTKLTFQSVFELLSTSGTRFLLSLLLELPVLEVCSELEESFSDHGKSFRDFGVVSIWPVDISIEMLFLLSTLGLAISSSEFAVIVSALLRGPTVENELMVVNSE